MHVNNLLPMSMVAEDVHWLLGFNCLIRRLLCVQSIRLKANIYIRDLPHLKSE